MTTWTLLVFFSGVLAGASAVGSWIVIGFWYGFWWGAAGAIGMLLLVMRLAAMPLLNRGLRYFWEAMSLFVWAEKHSVEHWDESAPEGTWRGTALQLVTAYWREWRDDEAVDVLRELKKSGSGLARNPDTGRNFTVFLSRGESDQIR